MDWCLANEVDIALLAYSSLALAIQNAGMEDLRVIADEAQEGVDGYYTSPFMVRKDSGIDKVEDVKGKVIADVEIHAGELIGVAGLEGHGQQEFLEALRGTPGVDGHVLYDPYDPSRPVHFQRRGETAEIPLRRLDLATNATLRRVARDSEPAPDAPTTGISYLALIAKKFYGGGNE